MYRVWRFAEEPKNNSYLALIDYIFENITEFSLEIFIKDLKTDYSERAIKLYEELSPYLVLICKDDRNGEEGCKECIFQANDETKKIINKYNSYGLNSWRSPEIFEVIRFLKEGREVWIVNISCYNMSAIFENNPEVIEEIEKVCGVDIIEIKSKSESDNEERIVTQEEINAIDEFINDKNNYILNEHYSEGEDFSLYLKEHFETIENADLEEINKFAPFLEENNINWYVIQEYFLLLPKDKLSNEVLYSEPFTRDIDDKHYKAVGCVYLNDKYLDNIGVELCEGSFEGTCESAIPVVLGYNFKSIFSLHEKIPFVYRDEEHNESIKYLEVSGFAKKDIFIPIWGRADRIENLGSFIIIPLRIQQMIDKFIKLDRSRSEDKSDIFSNYVYGYFNFKDDNEKNMVEEYSRKLGLNFDFISVKESYSQV